VTAVNKTTQTHPVFRRPAEERGYMVDILDEHGGDCPAGGRPPAGIVLHNPDGDSPMWVPAEDLAVVGDLFLRLHVLMAQLAKEVK
jgi:hypothetical protein